MIFLGGQCMAIVFFRLQRRLVKMKHEIQKNCFFLHMQLGIVSWPSLCFLWRNVYLGFLPNFLYSIACLQLRCMSCLYILEINPLSVT